jgi:hypothetical protein
VSASPAGNSLQGYIPCPTGLFERIGKILILELFFKGDIKIRFLFHLNVVPIAYRSMNRGERSVMITGLQEIDYCFYLRVLRVDEGKALKISGCKDEPSFLMYSRG